MCLLNQKNYEYFLHQKHKFLQNVVSLIMESLVLIALGRTKDNEGNICSS